MLSQCRLIILRTLRFSESDLIIHGLSDRGQRLNFIARSALKSKKRFGGGVLEPSHCIKVNYSHPKAQVTGDELLKMSEASLEHAFPGLRKDYQKLDAALYCLKLISAVVKEGDVEQPALFNLLGHGLRVLENAHDLSCFRLHFEAKLLSQQGVLPPDPEFEKLVKVSIANNANVDLSDDEKRRLRNRLDQVMNAYVVV